MSRITQVEVEGFWETHDFSTKLFPDVTFFIGPNGSGKTTFINLMAAALLGDFQTLDKLSFHRIKITTSPKEGQKASTITVSKKRTKERPYPTIDYKIFHGHSQKEIHFSLDDFEEQVLLRRAAGSHRLYRDYRKVTTGISSTIQELVKVSWLSVNRASYTDRPTETKFDSAVDQKVADLANDLVRYFSLLSAQKDDEVLLFQQKMFSSLIEVPSVDSLFKFSKILQADDERAAVAEIFRELHITSSSHERTINHYFKEIEILATRISQTPDFHFSLEDIVLLSGFSRIKQLVITWRSLGGRLSKIFEPKDKYVEILNSMLERKRMDISESNDLSFVSRSGKSLTLQMLSSGEKQLLILLSEALLQKEQPFIYIADEPEISLHVSWQERLVTSITALNGAAQLVIATHSPDIVGTMDDRVIDMAALIP